MLHVLNCPQRLNHSTEQFGRSSRERVVCHRWVLWVGDPYTANIRVDVHYQPQGGAVASGQQLLENFLQGVDSSTTIQGSRDSTPIESLQQAMSNIRLSPVTIPALHQNLITTASLVFPTDIIKTGLAQTTFVLANPFTASLNLLEVTATATLGNLTLGKIDHVDQSANPIHADGHANITSPTLPFEFNLDPVTIIELLLTGAKANGVDLGPLVEVFQIVLSDPGAKTGVRVCSFALRGCWLSEFLVDQCDRRHRKPTLRQVRSWPRRLFTAAYVTCSGKQFDVNDAILNALKNLKVALDIDSSVKIDDCGLSYLPSCVDTLVDLLR